MSVSLTPCNSHPPGPSETPQTSGLLGSGGACLALLWGSPAAVVSCGGGSWVGVGSGWRISPQLLLRCQQRTLGWARAPPTGRSQQASPRKGDPREEERAPKWSCFFCNRASSLLPSAVDTQPSPGWTWDRTPRGSWEPPHHSSEHRDSCRITNKPQKTPDKRRSQGSFLIKGTFPDLPGNL